jgi:Asp-tRNA(Asn)/Glu-tRNA(Gln) amidotransferase A subunit family amidase
MVPLALGTQTAGSIIRPASYCGAVGYKPTHGIFPIAGIKALAQSLDTLGGFSRSVADLALLRAAMIGAPAAFAPPAGPPRIGLYRTPQWPEATADTHRALENAAQQLAKAGAEVRDAELAPEYADLVAAQETIQGFEGVRCCAYELRHHREQLSPRLLELMEAGRQTSYAAYAAAMALAERCRQDLETVFTAHDVLLVPSAPGEAPSGLSATGNPLFNRMWTLLHVPAVSLPGYVGANGLPVGVQIIGAIGEDDRLLAIADWIHARLV